jgi:5'-nucleotidase
MLRPGLLLLWFLCFSSISYSQTIQKNTKRIHLIHTNDLHSYFDGYRAGGGGYSRVKTAIFDFKREALLKGDSSLVLDGGDFGEGGSFFLSDRGADAFRALDLMGVEAAVIGNHDFMMGGKSLIDQITRSELRAQLLSANLRLDPDDEADLWIKPYEVFYKSGYKIAVLGLTTSELHFQYPIKPEGYIKDPIKAGLLWEEKIREIEKPDLLIALTHLGIEKDRKLLKKSRHIDLVVGGHSHTKLARPIWVSNKNKVFKPIIQAGAHGLNVGRLVLEFHPKHGWLTKNYKLQAIDQEVDENKKMKTFVERSRLRRSEMIDGSWTEKIGESKIPLTGYLNGKNREFNTCWSEHLARLTRKATRSHVGLHVDGFLGQWKSPGTIQYGHLIENFPHVRAFGDQGWEIAVIKKRGRLLVKAIQLLEKLGFRIGLSVDRRSVQMKNQRTAQQFSSWTNLWSWMWNRTENLGLSIQWKKRGFYLGDLSHKPFEVALPAEVAFAVDQILPDSLSFLLGDFEYTGVYYWPAMRRYVREHSPLRCLP